MDKIKEVEEKNRLRDWRRQNHDEVKKNIVQAKKSKEIATQAQKSTKWKGLRTIFSPSNIYHVPHPIEENIKITLAQTTSKKTNGSPNEDTQQSTKIGTPNEM